MKRNKWWIAGLIMLSACNGYPERYPDPAPVPVSGQGAYEDRKTEHPDGLTPDTSMSLMDNGMILMLGMLEPLNGKDTIVVYTGRQLTRP